MSEHDEQATLIYWATICVSVLPELDLLYAIPNGAKLPYKKTKYGRFSREAMKLVAEGMRKGIPDLFLSVPNGEHHGLYIEMKFGKNKPSSDQIRVIAALREQGYKVVLCYGWREAVKEICDYLGKLQKYAGANLMQLTALDTQGIGE